MEGGRMGTNLGSNYKAKSASSSLSFARFAFQLLSQNPQLCNLTKSRSSTYKMSTSTSPASSPKRSAKGKSKAPATPAKAVTVPAVAPEPSNAIATFNNKFMIDLVSLGAAGGPGPIIEDSDTVALAIVDVFCVGVFVIMDGVNS